MTEAFQESLELFQRVEGEGKAAAPLGGLEVHAGLGADQLGDAAAVGRVLVGWRTIQGTDAFLELAPGRIVTQGLLDQEALPGSRLAQEKPGTTGAQCPCLDVVQPFGVELEDSQQVGQGVPRALEARGGLLVGRAELAQQALYAAHLLPGITVLALDVLHQCLGQGRVVVGLAHHCRQGCQPRKLRRPPASLAGNHLIALRQVAHSGRTMSGCSIPSGRLESASSLSESGAKSLRG